MDFSLCEERRFAESTRKEERNALRLVLSQGKQGYTGSYSQIILALASKRVFLQRAGLLLLPFLGELHCRISGTRYILKYPMDRG